MTSYTSNILYLGNRADADTQEGWGNASLENPGTLLGSYDSTDGMAVQTVTVQDNSGWYGGGANGLIEENVVYNLWGDVINGASDDTVQYDLGAGNVDTQLDIVQLANVTVTLGDGSTLALRDVVITQMTNGDVFLNEHPDQPTVLDGLNIQSITVNSIDSTVYSSWLLPPSITNSQIVCFEQNTRIRTDQGEVAVADLRPGDLVLTRDHGLQPVLWTGGHQLDKAHLTQHPNHRPILIRAGALGPGLPTRDLTASPQHRLLIRSRIALTMFGTTEVLAAAKHLLALDGVCVLQDCARISYRHICLPRHEIILADGHPAESLYPGPQALQALRSPTFASPCEVLTDLPAEIPDKARRFLTGREARKLVERHIKNRKPIYDAALRADRPNRPAARTRAALGGQNAPPPPTRGPSPRCPAPTQGL